MRQLMMWMLTMAMLVALVGCGGSSTPNNDDVMQTSQGGGDHSAAVEETDSGNGDAYTGDVTESVVRNYQVASESDFEYNGVQGGIRVTKYLGTDTIVVIPETIEGEPVVEVGGLMFANDSSVRGVLVPSGVTELTQVFTNNQNLEVVICEGVELVGDNTFNNCMNLHTVVLGDSLHELGENSFAGCSVLKELYISPNMTKIDKNIAPTVFFWCDSLTIIGESGSYIESFCAEQGIPFQAK